MGGKCSTRKQRGGGGCCNTNASAPCLYGGYKYDRKASLASRKRLLSRLSRSKTRKAKPKGKAKKRRRYKGTKRRGRRRYGHRRR